MGEKKFHWHYLLRNFSEICLFGIGLEHNDNLLKICSLKRGHEGKCDVLTYIKNMIDVTSTLKISVELIFGIFWSAKLKES